MLDAHHARDATRVWHADTERRGQEYYLVRHVIVQPIEGADAPSFAVLSQGYARDRARVYFEGRVMDGAEPAGFRVLDMDFSQVRPGSPASFQVLGRGYVRSDRAVWHLGEPLRGVDLKSFEVLPEGAASGPPGDEADARDATRRYRGGEPLARSR